MKIIITTILTILIIVGCVTTKDKGYKKNTSISTIDSITSVITDSIRKVYEEKYKEVGFYIDFYNENQLSSNDAIDEMKKAMLDTSMAADSLRKMIKDFKCPESTVKYNTDGSVEIKGRIKNLSARVLDLQKSLDSARKYTEKKADVKINNIKETITITKVKKQKPLWWIFPLVALIFYVVGWKFPPSKLVPAVKKIKSLWA